MNRNDISLAEWALVEEIRAGDWKTLDFPRVARTDFDINGIELVNTLLEVPTLEYLTKLKSNASDHGVSIVLMMVDNEGDGCSPDKKEQRQFGIQHRKWIDIAHYLGCHAIRTNCRGPKDASPTEAWEWAATSYRPLLEYAGQAGISVLVENHGGLSDNADWLVALVQKLADPYFGCYPDWREPSSQFDNYDYLRKVLPYARGMSYRNQPTEGQTAEMVRLTKASGYQGWYGIESSGRQAVKKGKFLLEKYLFDQENKVLTNDSDSEKNPALPA